MLPRFGNYIGEAGESEDGSQHGDVSMEPFSYGEGSEAEEGSAIHDQQLMEIDGDDLLAIVQILSNTAD